MSSRAADQGGCEGMRVIFCVLLLLLFLFMVIMIAGSLNAEFSSGDAGLIDRCQMN